MRAVYCPTAPYCSNRFMTHYRGTPSPKNPFATFRQSSTLGDGRELPRIKSGGILLWEEEPMVVLTRFGIFLLPPRSFFQRVETPEKRWLEDDPFLLGFGNFSGAFAVETLGGQWELVGRIYSIPPLLEGCVCVCVFFGDFCRRNGFGDDDDDDDDDDDVTQDCQSNSALWFYTAHHQTTTATATTTTNLRNPRTNKSKNVHLTFHVLFHKKSQDILQTAFYIQMV